MSSIRYGTISNDANNAINQSSIKKLNLQLHGISRSCNNRPEPAPYYMSPTASFKSKKKSSVSSFSGSRPGIKVGSISSRPTYNLSTYEKSSTPNNQNLTRNVYSLRNSSFDLSESGYGNSSMSQSLMKGGKYEVNDLDKNNYDDIAGHDYDDEKLKSRNIDQYIYNDDGYISNGSKNGGFSDKNLRNSAQKGILPRKQNQNEAQDHFVSRSNPRNHLESNESYRNSNIGASLLRDNNGRIRNANPSHPAKNFDPRTSDRTVGPKLETKNSDPRSRPYGTGEAIRNGGAGAGKIISHTDGSAFNEYNYFNSSDNYGNRKNYMKYNNVNGDIEVEEAEVDYDHEVQYESAGRVRDVFTMPQFKRYQDKMGVHNYLQR